MYLEVYRYDPHDVSSVDYIQREVRDFINYHPRFKIVKTESLVTGDLVTIHLWFKEL